MRPIVLILLLLSVLALPVQAQDATDGPTGTIATEADAAQDAEIATRIRNIIAELGNYGDITVTVAEGIVTLRGTTDSQAEINALGALVTRIDGVVAIKNDVAETTDIARRLDPAVDRFRARLTQLITVLPLLVVALVVFAAICFIGVLLSRWRRPWERLAPNSFIATLYQQIVQVAFVLGGLVIALDVLDASALLGTILGAAGIVGLAFGFAVRDTVENYIASIMLSIRQPFRPNDTIEINDEVGKVIRLTSRATILLSFDGNHIRIPNATVFKSRIVNYSENAERRFLFTLGIDATADLDHARTLAVQTVQALPFVLAVPAAQCWFESLTTSGMDITVTGWINQNETSIVLARGEAMRQVMLALDDANIVLPNPTYALRFDGAALPDTKATGNPAMQGNWPTQPAPGRKTHVEPHVAEVTAAQETDLDRIVATDRDDARKEDLLSPDAKSE